MMSRVVSGRLQCRLMLTQAYRCYCHFARRTRCSSCQGKRGFGVDADVAEAVVILSALELEYKEVRAQVSELRLAQHDAGTVFEVGVLPGRAGTIAMAVTGPGIQAAAVVTERAITTFRPRAVLFV